MAISKNFSLGVILASATLTIMALPAAPRLVPPVF
jgi:hypothetical protein